MATTTTWRCESGIQSWMQENSFERGCSCENDDMAENDVSRGATVGFCPLLLVVLVLLLVFVLVLPFHLFELRRLLLHLSL